VAVAAPALGWKELVVLDIATEDEYWLNELASDAVIREVLPSMVRDGLVEMRNFGDPVDPASTDELLGDDRNWNLPAISFYATDVGRESYFALDTDQLTGLWRQALNEGYPNAASRSGGLAKRSSPRRYLIEPGEPTRAKFRRG
jgi:hypothetical protein